MRKLTLTSLLLVAAISALPGSSLAAKSPAAEPQALKPMPRVYSVHYRIYELANGKRINSRSYELMTSSYGHNNIRRGSLRVGNKVPIGTGAAAFSNGKSGQPTQFLFQSVGMDIDCFLMGPAPAGKVMLDTQIHWQSMAGEGKPPLPPILRTLEFQGPALVPLDKPTIIGKVDDVTSNHEYEIEVTVKKIE